MATTWTQVKTIGEGGREMSETDIYKDGHTELPSGQVCKRCGKDGLTALFRGMCEDCFTQWVEDLEEGK